MFPVWEVVVSSQGCFLCGPSISFKLNNLLVNFPSVFGLYDVVILVKMSLAGNSVYGVFVGFNFFFNCSFCN